MSLDAIAKEVQIRLTAKDAASGVISQSAKRITKEMSSIGDAATTVSRMFRAGGALYIASEVMGALADGIGNAADEFGKLQDYSKGAADRIAEGIPVFNQYWKLLRNIREAITGEELAAKKKTAEQEKMNGLLMRQVELQKQITNLNSTTSAPNWSEALRELGAQRENDPVQARIAELQRLLKQGKITGSVYAKTLDEEGISATMARYDRQEREIWRQKQIQELKGEPERLMGIVQKNYAGMFDFGAGSKEQIKKDREQSLMQQFAQMQRAAAGYLRVVAPGGNAIEAEKASILAQAEQAQKAAAGFFESMFGSGERKTPIEREQEARSAQLREARFLTGVGARNPLQKPTEDTAKNTKRSNELLADVARALREGQTLRLY